MYKYSKHTLAILALSCAVPAANAVLTHHYRAGEDATLTGSTIDSSPNQVGGSLNSTGTASPQLVAGVAFSPYDRASSLAADTTGGGYFTIADDPSLDFGTGSFSIGVWARSDSDGGNWKKLFQRNTSEGFWQAETGAGGKVNFNIRNGGNSEILSPAIFNQDNLWHHVLAVRDSAAGEIRLYIDGGLVGTDTNEPDVGPLNGGFAVWGGGDNGDNVFSGNVDDFRIWDHAIDDAGAAAVYNSGLGDFIPEPTTSLLAALGLLLGFTRRRR